MIGSFVGQGFMLLAILFSLVVFNIPKVDRTTPPRVYLWLSSSAFFLAVTLFIGERHVLFSNTPDSDLRLLVIVGNVTFAFFGMVRYFAKRRIERLTPSTASR